MKTGGLLALGGLVIGSMLDSMGYGFTTWQFWVILGAAVGMTVANGVRHE